MNPRATITSSNPSTTKNFSQRFACKLRPLGLQPQLTIAKKKQLEIHASELEDSFGLHQATPTAHPAVLPWPTWRILATRETGHTQPDATVCPDDCEGTADDGPYAAMVNRRFLEDLYRSSPLHDIGKVAVPDSNSSAGC